MARRGLGIIIYGMSERNLTTVHSRALFCFLLKKKVCVYIIWKAQLQKGRKGLINEDLSSLHRLIPQKAGAKNQEAGALSIAPTWVILYCFPKSLSGSWIGNRVARIQSSIHRGCWHCYKQHFNLLCNNASPSPLKKLNKNFRHIENKHRLM